MTSLLSVPVLLSIQVPLVDKTPDPEDVAPGWIYAIVLFGLFAVTILLWLSMRKQLGKIHFREDPPAESAESADENGPPAD